jgi:hypothetical protein
VISLHIIILLVWIHFVADFVLQSNTVAINKSKSNMILLQHVLIYGVLFIPISFYFAVINAMLHFVVDYITSRVTSVLWAHDERHWFFITIGLDQALHLTCLLSTYYLSIPV